MSNSQSHYSHTTLQLGNGSNGHSEGQTLCYSNRVVRYRSNVGIIYENFRTQMLTDLKEILNRKLPQPYFAETVTYICMHALAEEAMGCTI